MFRWGGLPGCCRRVRLVKGLATGLAACCFLVELTTHAAKHTGRGTVQSNDCTHLAVPAPLPPCLATGCSYTGLTKVRGAWKQRGRLHPIFCSAQHASRNFYEERSEKGL